MVLFTNGGYRSQIDTDGRRISCSRLEKIGSLGNENLEKKESMEVKHKASGARLSGMSSWPAAYHLCDFGQVTLSESSSTSVMWVIIELIWSVHAMCGTQALSDVMMVMIFLVKDH